ncbi:hypothetical protein [Chryseobacterium salviniae]|uniref:ABC transporter permease n=1 Tax=Chryseobacterium salviniae TaxID=3101750 RepID=A0ABU6HTM8_9FLAO|nr:hypothetical protein [Chryseobacterium sp. T9W2-O]MEC3875832.1 hypothetical protein [Chryseobacterium sp. T9W2-O]
MKELINLSLLYTKYNIRKKNFLIFTVVLLVLGFLLIPNEKAEYVTFYIGNISVYPNKFWIGNMGAVFSNIIISLLLFFFIVGERENEIMSNTYYFEETSTYTPFYKNLYKIAALFIISIIFLIILNISLIASNYSYGINIFAYLKSLFYFSVPFLFFISFIIYFLEFYVPKKTGKILIFIAFILIILFNDRFVNIIGLNELYLYIHKISHTQNYFAIGYLKKSERIKLLTLHSYNAPLFIVAKVFWLLLTFVLMYIVSLMKTPDPSAVFEKIPANVQAGFKSTKEISANFLKNLVPIQLDFLSLIKKDIVQLSKVYTPKRILAILFLWVILFVTPMANVQKFLLPVLMLYIIYLNKDFVSKLYVYDLGYFILISPFKRLNIFLSQAVIISFLYILACLPHIMKSDSSTGLLIALHLIMVSILQVSAINLLKKSLLVNIILIILFSSYLTGKPIINLLYF